MKNFNEKIQAQFDEMCKTGKLYRVELPGAFVWEKYISSFKNDPMFRDPSSSEHRCNLCKNFIRRYGNIVAVDSSNKLMTIFDVNVEGEYKLVAERLSDTIKSSNISEVFFETFQELNKLNYEKCSKANPSFRLGIHKNVKRYTKEEAEKFGVVKAGEIKTFHHLHLDLPTVFVDMSGNSVESIMAGYRDAKNVFQRSMEEISSDTLKLVIDLINQESLLDGKTHLYKVEQILPLKLEYDSLPVNERDNWCWVKSYKLPFAKFKNELIGVLCSELAEGKEINDACMAWNKRVDPANYMKAKAPITKKQIEEAKKFVEENGYEASFNRRFAVIEDIKVSEILHVNAGDGKLKGVSIFDGVKSTKSVHKRNEFDGVEEISIDNFMEKILPSCSSVEVMLRSLHEDNMVSMTTSSDTNSKPIFKWDNNYSWTYNGNLAGKSFLKEEVKSRGGKVDGVLRFSISWNESGQDNSDLDAWCIQPGGERIGFSTDFRKDRYNKLSSCGGQLDLDIVHPYGKLAVENIYFRSVQELREGVYVFYINQFANRNFKGVNAEIEFNGEIYSYKFDRNLVRGDNVVIAHVTFDGGNFSIEHKIPETSTSNKTVYGLETNQFHKVNLVCLSPNHWGNNQVGNKHYFFMLDGCKCSDPLRSFHNENLIPELAQHRKVLEVLGDTSKIQPSNKQLSGLGFNATKRDELIVRLGGNFKRVVKIKF